VSDPIRLSKAFMIQDPPSAEQSSLRRGTGAAVAWAWLLFIVLASMATGWVLGRGMPGERPVGMMAGPAGGAETPGGPSPGSGGTEPGPGTVTSAEVGRLKAEMLRLRVLFKRLAEAAQLDDDGEFDLDFDVDARTGDGEPLSALDPNSPDAVPLLIERFDPMLAQSARMARIFDERHRAWSQRVSGRPLADGTLSSGYGLRLDPISGRRVMHRGLDFVAPPGSPVLALADGVVTWAGPNGGYGLLVELEHAEGFRTRYAHNDSTIATLGSRVRKGHPIATLGSSGRSTGPHLHLEVRQHGRALDPGLHVR